MNTTNTDTTKIWDDESQSYWNITTPRYDVDRWLGNQFVGTSNEEIERKLQIIIKKAQKRSKWPQEIVDETIRYALFRHKKNRELYLAVCTGRF